MHYQIHPPFLEETETKLEQNQTLAYLAQIEDILFEFEHSEEFRACSNHYLHSPKFILQDFIHETGLAPDLLDTEALAHGLFSVIPSRIVGLIQDDADQIFREQVSFWAFVAAHWQFQHAHECLSYLDLRARIKLNKIIGLSCFDPCNRRSFRQQPNGYPQRDGSDWVDAPYPEQDVFTVGRHTEL